MTQPHQGAVPAEDARFLLLETPERKEQVKDILGAVVPLSNLTLPFSSYRPNLDNEALSDGDRKTLEDKMAKFWKDETKGTVTITDITMGKKCAKTTASQAKLTNMLTLFAKNATSVDVTIRAGTAKRFTIKNYESQLIDNLIKCDPWKAELETMYFSRPEKQRALCLVTGVFVVKDLEVSWNWEAEKQIDFEAQVEGDKILMAAGIPNPLGRNLDLGFEFNHGRSTETEVFAKCADDIVFALSYDLLGIEDNTGGKSGKGLFSKWRGGHEEKKKPSIERVWIDKNIRGLGVDPYVGISEEPGASEPGAEEDTFYHGRPKYVTVEALLKEWPEIKPAKKDAAAIA